MVILCVCLRTVQYRWISIGLVIVQLSIVFCPLIQYVSFFCEAFPERPWTVKAFPSFIMAKSFTSWHALLLLFFLRFSPTSLHCSPIQFSFAFFIHLLVLLFTSLYFSDPSGSNLFFFSSLLLSQDQEFLQ